MPLIASFKKRPFYRNFWFWIAGLFLLYTATGFLIIPFQVKNLLTTQIKQQLGWNTELSQVKFNPLTFSLSLDGLRLSNKQNKPIVRIRQLYTDLKLSSLTKGILTISQVRLLQPEFFLTFDKSGIDNFSASWKSHHQTEEPDKIPTSLDRLKLLFQKIRIIKGSISIVDQNSHRSQSFHLSAINLNLQNLATYPVTGGDYQLSLSLGSGQTLNWKGNLSAVPFHSSGIITLNQINSLQYLRYLQPLIPYKLIAGKADLKAQYQLSINTASKQMTTRFEIRNGMLSLNDVQFDLPDSTQKLLKFKRLLIGPVSYNLRQHRLDIKKIALQQPSAWLSRKQNGKLAMLAPFSTPAQALKPAKTKLKASSRPAFTWSIHSISISGGKINWEDLSVKPPVFYQVTQFNANLDGLSNQLGQSLTFQTSTALADSGTSQVSGELTLQPFSIKSTIHLQNLSLSPFSTYLSQQIPLLLTSGKLSLNGNFRAKIPPAKTKTAASGELVGKYEGDVIITQLDTRTKNQNQLFAGWKSLSLRPLKITLNPFSIAINDINITEPFSQLQISADGSSTLNALETKSTSVAANTTASPAAKEPGSIKRSATVLPLTIGRILVNNGRFQFSDLTQKPAFNIQVNQLNGELSGISPQQNKRAKLDFNALINKTSTLSIKGQITPFSSQPFAKVSIKLNNLQMPELNSYIGRYTGYLVDKGSLSLNVKYLLDKNYLKGDNQILLNQLQLGKSVNSPDATSLPLPLALAIIRNSDGNITLNLPISGNINDPSFHLGSILLTAFTQIITKAATAPFSLLGALLGSSAEELASVVFKPGQTQLTQTATTRLDKLATVLKERPALILEIQPTSNKLTDSLVLIKDQVKHQIDILRAQTNSKAPNSPVTTATILDKLLIKQGMAVKLSALQKKWKITSKTTKPLPSSYINSMKALLYKKTLISPLDLKKLAQSRAAVIYNYLKNTGDVSTKQLFITKAIQQKKSSSAVAVSFNLKTR